MLGNSSQLFQRQQPKLNTSVSTSDSSASKDPSVQIAEGLLAPIGFVAVVWIIVFLMHLNFWKTIRNKIVTVKRIHQQIPCTNCQYFCNNAYLKCAVNPAQVLTKQASECSDYRPVEDKVVQKV